MIFLKNFFSVPPFFFWRSFFGARVCVLRSFYACFNPLIIALLTQTRAFYTVFLCVYAHYNWRIYLACLFPTTFTPPRAGAHAHGRVILKIYIVIYSLFYIQYSFIIVLQFYIVYILLVYSIMYSYYYYYYLYKYKYSISIV